MTLAARLAGKTAAETISVMLAVFARIEPALRKSITFDNDTAFAQHALLRTMALTRSTSSAMSLAADLHLDGAESLSEIILGLLQQLCKSSWASEGVRPRTRLRPRVNEGNGPLPAALDD